MIANLPNFLKRTHSQTGGSRTPSAPRAKYAGNHYHIVLRGNRREPLFSTPADHRALNRFAIEALRRFDATLHAYCLMPHHFRFLVQMEEKRLIKAVRKIVTRYSRYLRRHTDHAERPFVRPYEAQRISTGDDFLACLRSIHLGPVIADLVVTPEEYRWSSHRAYLGYKSVAWVQTDFGLSLLSPDRSRARSVYPEFISAGLGVHVDEEKPALTPTNAVLDRLMGVQQSHLANTDLEKIGHSPRIRKFAKRRMGNGRSIRTCFLSIY